LRLDEEQEPSFIGLPLALIEAIRPRHTRTARGQEQRLKSAGSLNRKQHSQSQVSKTVFTKNRERLLAGEVAKTLFAEVLAQARSRDLLSTEHFSVDGTLIEAWASHKSFTNARMEVTNSLPMTPVIPRLTSTASSAATTPTNQLPIPRRDWPARARAKRPSSATWDMR
jgi:hypothetical protein